ncbi:hypothetical protein QN277_015318 [Acacia crassicarpa]|uniref:Uncharacterized protein n=1 Tax=Acacia crassicarpa TaxID=499986 RepID=A0AAE1JTZ2_9FABA|nr:hypothetical protein QN277_015318 [Acacia crassicarpa]
MKLKVKTSKGKNFEIVVQPSNTINVKTVSKNKVPLVRSLTLTWVTFCIDTSNKSVVLTLQKDYVPICMERYDIVNQSIPCRNLMGKNFMEINPYLVVSLSLYQLIRTTAKEELSRRRAMYQLIRIFAIRAFLSLLS